MIRIGTRRGSDSTDVLIAGSAQASVGATPARVEDRPKHFWLELNGTAGVHWHLDVVRAGRYAVEIAVRAPDADIEITLDGAVVARTRCLGPEWQLISIGTIELAQGSRILGLAVDDPQGGDYAVRSVELLHEHEIADRELRLAEYRAHGRSLRERLRGDGFGIMLQYGPWSFPRSGGAKPALDAHVDAFDVQRFADTVAETGAGHVIWSLTWWSFELASPCSAVDRIVGHPGLTARRDLIGEIAAALHERGILFLLYYHPGHEAHLGYESTEWWRAQRWPSEFAGTGRGDRVGAFCNAVAIFAELGQRYGELLDGWLLDDGMIYYPAPFERLARELRAGNPSRLVGYNSWILPRVTRFQDLDFGEGLRELGDLDIGADGAYRSGRAAGLLAHAMTPLQPEWGVHQADQYQPLDAWSELGLDALIVEAARRVPLSLVLLMWFPGEFDPVALERLRRLRRDFLE
ncbi:hypothetical protein HQQ81_21915 [Microbacteriaceae bacterium VKM Ac-2854]|nr:hypothetical protein [Microbacteriaceae bacterium VKM Ac-2854]